MKKLLIATLILTGGAVAVNAQEVAKDSAATTTTTTVTSSTAITTDQDGYVVIQTAELPASIKKSLDSEDYKGWIINATSYNKKEEKYLVELKNGAESKKVKFNKDGKALKD